MTQPDSAPSETTPSDPDAPDTHDAREGSGDPETDPAAIGEVSFEEPDADGGAVPDGSDTAG